jgi:hypothetical protein
MRWRDSGIGNKRRIRMKEKKGCTGPGMKMGMGKMKEVKEAMKNMPPVTDR